MRLPHTLLTATLTAVAMLTACQPNATPRKTDAATRTFGNIAFKPCVLGGEQGLPPVEAQCGTFSVAEDAAHPGGRKIALNLAWLPAQSKNGGTPDPVFFLAGGPGQAATEVAGQVEFALREVRKQRDI